MGTKLGQNFLKHPEIAAKIAGAAKIAPQDTVLEIGPGRGILTTELLARAAHVIAVEKDERLADYLVGKFALEIATKKLILVRGDALEFDPQTHGFKNNDYKVVANIPYYITGQIIRKFLEAKIQPSAMTLLVQKEVAERIVAKPPHLNLLALSVQCYGAPQITFKVSRASFSPPPNVDSAVITIENISRAFFQKNKISEPDFFAMLHAGFAHPRKQLASNLSSDLKLSTYIGRTYVNNAAQILTTLGLPSTARAENLSLEQWAALTKMLNYPHT